MRLAGDLHQKNFRKISKNFFPQFSVFFKRFTVEKDEVSVVSSWRRIVFEIYGYPFGIFWRCKIDEILTIMSFYPWLSVWYCLFGFLQKFTTFFASVCEARLRLCVYFDFKLYQLLISQSTCIITQHPPRFLLLIKNYSDHVLCDESLFTRMKIRRAPKKMVLMEAFWRVSLNHSEFSY